MDCFRHNDDMIQRLELAGLGFYVKASETEQKLGIYVLMILYLTHNFRKNSSSSTCLPCSGFTS